MFKDKSDISWERIGRKNPYWGVLSCDKYRNEMITSDSKAAFFQTGENHIKKVLTIMRRHFDKVPNQGTALDYGCGVGRLVIPLASHFANVVGVDVSPSMIAEAKNNCSIRGINNVVFITSDDNLSNIKDTFVFINSFIVMQHIPVIRGLIIINQLIDRLQPGGVIALHFPFMREASRLRKVVNYVRVRFNPLNTLVNLVQGKLWNEQFIQMNSYDIKRILKLLSMHGITDVFIEIIDYDGYMQAYVFAQKPLHPFSTKNEFISET